MRPLAGADAYHVLEESPAQHMHTMKIAVVDAVSARERITYQRTRAWAARRLTQVPPLRWRLVTIPFGLGRPIWIDGPDLDLDYHVRRARVPAPGGDAELDDLVSELASAQLARDQPLWQVWFVDGLEGDRVALVFKLHHALADGTASVRLFETIFDPVDDVSAVPVGAVMRAEALPTVRTRLGVAFGLQRRQWARLPGLVRRARSRSRRRS